MSQSGVRQVLALTLGWVTVDRSVSVYGDRSSVRLREPIPAVLCESEADWILLDTGCNPEIGKNALVAERYTRQGEDPLELPSTDPLVDSLSGLGLSLVDITRVAVSHLHYDHVGGLAHFAGTTPISCQRAEFDYGLGDPVSREAYGVFRSDFDDPRMRFELIEGDHEIAPGITAVTTPGHTPGHQSFVIEVDPSVGGGGYVFAFDAADLEENLHDEVAPGGLVDCSPADAVASIRRLKAIASRASYRLIPGHDPVIWPEIAAELSERFGGSPRR